MAIPINYLLEIKLILLLKKNYPKKKFYVKFSIPITKSTTIEITKNEENKIISKKL